MATSVAWGDTAPTMTIRDHDLVEEARASRPRVSLGPGRASKPWRWLALEAALLGLIVAAALALRFRGIEWGTGYYLHPDELFLTSVMTNITAPSGWREYLDSATSPLNPFNTGTGYVYGTFPLFLANLVGSYTEYGDISNAHIPGRWLSALADTGTVVMTWWIGRMLWNRGTGLLAALLMAFTVLHIGAAHYFTADAWSAFFAAAAFAFTLAGWKGQRWICYALAGLMVGLATASKPTLLASFGFLLLPALEMIRTSGWGALRPRLPALTDDEPERPFPVLPATALALFVAVWTIRIAQPYMFQGPSLFSFRFEPRWLADIEFWRGVQAGEIDYPPGIQWAERTPILFQIDNLVRWGMGPGLGLAALGGLAWSLWSLASARRWPSWLTLGLVGWIGFHLLYFGLSAVKTQRYLMPAYPFLVLLAAAALVAVFRWGWRRGPIRLLWTGWSVRAPRWLHPGTILPVVAVVTTVLYGSAFVSVYSEPQTRAEASRWIAANVPDGSSLAAEYWDLGLPVGVPEIAGRTYTGVQIEPYADENDFKLTQMIGALQRSDYVVLSSNRLIDSITRMPWRYPMATRYYEALYTGELGFEQVAHFTSFPQLFGVEIDDRSAEEALTVYDHPEVTIFQKTDRWDAKAAWYLLDEALGSGGMGQRPAQTQPSSMMLDGAEREAMRTATSLGSIFDPGSIPNRFPAVAWYLALQLIALPIVPILWRFLPWLPDRGYALAKTIGLFAVGWAAWWLATLGWLEFGLVPIALAWGAVFVASGVSLRHSAAGFVASLRAGWQWIAATEAVLLGGYLIAIGMRSQLPDLWVPGRVGSQLQNMATFNAMTLTPVFPAYDPWLADGSIHDFTFGFLPWAVLTRLTGIVPESAYSLTLATLAALIILNAWLAATVLIARFRRSATSWGAIAGGLLAPVLLIGIGSWTMAQRIGSGDWGLNGDGSVVDAVQGLWTVVTSNSAIPPGAWQSTDEYANVGVLEFPLLSFLTGEMAIQHLGMPLLLAGVVLLVGFLTCEEREPGTTPGGMGSLGGWRPSAAFLVGSGLVVGWTFAANPVFGLLLMELASGMLVLAVGAARSWEAPWVILRDTLLAAGAIGTVAGVAVAPFIAAYGAIATQRVPLNQPLSVNEYVGHFGALLAIALGYLLWQVWSVAGSVRRVDGVTGAIVIGASVMLVVLVALAAAVGHMALFLPVVLLLVAVVTWHRHDDIRHLTILGLLTLVVLAGIAANRMAFETGTPQQNIPQQASLASWTLLAVAAGAILTVALATAWGRASAWRMAGKRIASVVWLAALAVAIGAGAVYPALGVPDRRVDRLVDTGATLDTFAFMEQGQLGLNADNLPVAPYDLSGDLAAIEWMRANLVGLPTIVEAPAQVGGWGGRISALTGYPAVIGVAPVQRQQRPGMERLIDRRYADVTTLYESLELGDIEPILQDYGVRIIYVGSLERATYPAAALAKFEAAAAAGELQTLYQRDGVTIYFHGGPRDSLEPLDP